MVKRAQWRLSAINWWSIILCCAISSELYLFGPQQATLCCPKVIFLAITCLKYDIPSHWISALFAENRTRCDNSFLTMYVSKQSKWRQLRKASEGTKILEWDSIFEADPECGRDELHLHWYINGLHQVHEDCREQIECLMTMGKGAAASHLIKWNATCNALQKLNQYCCMILMLFG
jgi:hypothetical protein